MFKARYKHIDFRFKTPATTSRGTLLSKPSTFIVLEKNGIFGVGECSTIPKLSIDPSETYFEKLNEICNLLKGNEYPNTDNLKNYPSIAFGIETALQDLQQGGKQILFANDFSEGKTGISINGLVWMGNKEFMQRQIKEKINSGFNCIKLKVGALDFDSELNILSDIRRHYSANDIEIRLDANGGFLATDALEKLRRLSEFSIHSIEQPIKPGQTDDMAYLSLHSPIPIVLDEELIGIEPDENWLKKIKPAYIVLKPSLIGGFSKCEQWIEIAQKNDIGWWITSALESNIGLNAIAQWTSTLNADLPQGLGTGQLFFNNISSPLEIKEAKLHYNISKNWNLSSLL